MAEFGRRTAAPAHAGTALDIDEGLRAHMLRVYNYMGLGLVITGLIAFAVSQMAVTGVASQAAAQLSDGTYLTQFGVLLYTTPLMWVVAFLPFAFVLVLSFGINRLSFGAAQLVFWAFAAVMGLSLSSIFLVYTGGSIAKVFFITAAMFGSMSLYGYTTRRDLTSMGSFLFMGLIGLIIAIVVNIFLQSSMLDFVISVAGVLVFLGLTAFDTQKIKEAYAENIGHEGLGKMAIMGALSLYLDFINLFLMLLRLFGNRN